MATTTDDYMTSAATSVQSAIDEIRKARQIELAKAATVPMKDSSAHDSHRRHMLANRALATAEKLLAEALEVLL